MELTHQLTPMLHVAQALDHEACRRGYEVKDIQLREYAGAPHAFANETLPPTLRLPNV
jgi:hypothetical protein